jgi:hypothetical protein
MGLIREPKNVDFIIKSEPWTDAELKQFREIMKKQRTQLVKAKQLVIKKGLKRLTSRKVHS